MKEAKGAGARAGRPRKANNMYRGVTDVSGEDSRFNVKLGKTRKQKRKLERKNAKRIRHEKKMEWLHRRKTPKSGPNDSVEAALGTSTHDDDEDYGRLEGEDIQKRHQKSVEDMELEYLEHQLMKNRKGKGRNGRVDLLQELKSEFLNDGFDDDFLDFLSNITRIGDNEVVLDRDSTLNQNVEQSEVVSAEEDDDHYENEDDHYDEDEDDQEEDEEESYESDVDTEKGEKKRAVRFAPDVVKPSKQKEVPSLETSKKLQIGLVNRLSEGNFTVITKELIGVYRDLLYHEADDNNTLESAKSMDSLVEGLCDCIIKMVIEDVNTVISLVTIQTALICSLASNISISVGYIYCSKIKQSFDASLGILFENVDGEELSDSKLVARNCLVSFSALFYFKIISVDIIFHLIKSITEKDLTEHTAQLLIIILKYSGNGIKSADDTSFNSIMDYLNTLMEGCKAVHGDLSNSRLRFVDQEIQSFKLSKSGKPLDNFEFLKNVIRDFSMQDHRIEIGLDEFSEFDSEYRKGKRPSTILSNRLETAVVSAKSSDSTNALLQKAGKLGLYSNSQKSTFIAITGSLSPVHAVERIMELGLKSSKYPEVLSTVIRCLMAEKSFNEFYLEVTRHLCKLPSVNGKKFTRATTSAVIVQIQNLENTSTKKANLFGKYFASLILSKLVQIRLLRFLGAEMSASTLSFVKIAFVHLLTMTPQDLEEYIIAQFLSLESEKIFTTLTNLWKETLRSHCTNVVSELACPVILLEAAKRIFK